MERSVKGWLDRESAWLQAIRSRPALADPVREIERQAEQVDALVRRARTSLDASLHRAGDDVAHTRARLLALSPASTLKRGYAIVQKDDGSVVRAAAAVADDEELTVRFAEDQVTVRAMSPDRDG
jgi:exodeoxyribonuclease VII large subunit